jgi:hypothetical protein
MDPRIREDDDLSAVHRVLQFSERVTLEPFTSLEVLTSFVVVTTKTCESARKKVRIACIAKLHLLRPFHTYSKLRCVIKSRKILPAVYRQKVR